MARIEPLGKAQLDELFMEVDRRMESAPARLHALWVQHRGHVRQQMRHATGAGTTGTMPAVPETSAEVRLRVQNELANATLAAAQAGQSAQRAVDHLGTAMSIERAARTSSTHLLALPGDPDPREE